MINPSVTLPSGLQFVAYTCEVQALVGQGTLCNAVNPHKPSELMSESLVCLHEFAHAGIYSGTSQKQPTS